MVEGMALTWGKKKSGEVWNYIGKFNPFAVAWFGYLLSIQNKWIKWFLWQMHSDTMWQICFCYNGRGPKTPRGKTAGLKIRKY